MEATDTEFNFEKGLNVFDKEKEFSQLSVQETKVHSVVFLLCKGLHSTDDLLIEFYDRVPIKNLLFSIPFHVMRWTVLKDIRLVFLQVKNENSTRKLLVR